MSPAPRIEDRTPDIRARITAAYKRLGSVRLVAQELGLSNVPVSRVLREEDLLKPQGGGTGRTKAPCVTCGLVRRINSSRAGNSECRSCRAIAINLGQLGCFGDHPAQITWVRRGLIWHPVEVHDPDRDTTSPPRLRRTAA